MGSEMCIRDSCEGLPLVVATNAGVHGALGLLILFLRHVGQVLRRATTSIELNERSGRIDRSVEASMGNHFRSLDKKCHEISFPFRHCLRPHKHRIKCQEKGSGRGP